MRHFREFAPHGTTTKKRQITHGSFAPPVAKTTATAEREDPSLVNKPVIFLFGVQLLTVTCDQNCVFGVGNVAVSRIRGFKHDQKVAKKKPQITHGPGDRT